MKKYFTISEFARLREIDINSLRYYEKLGILKPAYIDPGTKYRYYSAEQLPILDIIILSIQMGIPLKQLKNYIDENEEFHIKEFVEDGKRLTKERIKDLQNCLFEIENTLLHLEETSKYSACEGAYIRTYPERNLLVKEYGGSFSDVNTVEKTFSALLSYAKKQNIHLVVSMGVLYQFEDGYSKKYICCEIPESKMNDEKIITLPAADYLCVQIDWPIACDIQSIIEDTFKPGNHDTVFVSNLTQNRFHFGTKTGELQQLVLSPTTLHL